ncbi:MAG TPA: hypothetical protein VGJ18_12350 [Gemmatimonadaceae bacterium]|jgi:hypothetical protein
MHRIYFTLISVCVLAHPSYAQASADTASAFRRGQWGVEFIPTTTLTEGGVLRFSTPSRAWVLDGSASFDNESNTVTSGPDQSARTIGVNARIGPRWYHSEYERVVRFAGVGVTGSYSGVSQSGPNNNRGESWTAGAYGELGLQYLFTRHLGLGVRADVVVSRLSQHFTESGGTQHLTIDRLALNPLHIIGAFYF